MPLICTLHRDGKSIVKGSASQVVAGGAQGLYLTVAFPELRKVEQLLHVEFTTNPKVWVSTASHPQDKNYVGNTVGISLQLNPAAGTTLTMEAVAIGF